MTCLEENNCLTFREGDGETSEVHLARAVDGAKENGNVSQRAAGPQSTRLGRDVRCEMGNAAKRVNSLLLTST